VTRLRESSKGKREQERDVWSRKVGLKEFQYDNVKGAYLLGIGKKTSQKGRVPDCKKASKAERR